MIRRRYIEPSRWHLPILSLILGLIIGLLIGWLLWPVEWVNSWPTDLSEAARADYLAAVADAYVADGSEEGRALAQHRLRTMQENLADEINAAKRYFINNEPSNIRVSNLDQLATALGAHSGGSPISVEPNVIVPDITQPMPTAGFDAGGNPGINTQIGGSDTTTEEPTVALWLRWLLAFLSGIFLILLGLYALSWLAKRREQTQQERPHQPEPDLYADDPLESIQDEFEPIDEFTEDDYDFYDEEIEDSTWQQSGRLDPAETSRILPESEPRQRQISQPVDDPAGYEPYPQSQPAQSQPVQSQPAQSQPVQSQASRRNPLPAITTAVAATPGPSVEDSRIVRQRIAESASLHRQPTSRTAPSPALEGPASTVEDIVEDSDEDDFTGEDLVVDDFVEESDDIQLNRSIAELNQKLDDMPIYRQGDRREDRQDRQDMPDRSGVESLPSAFKSERLSARQNQTARAPTVGEARLKRPEPTTLLSTYAAHYHIGQPDYEDVYDIETEDEGHLGQVGVGIDGMGGILSQDPEQVIVLDVWLNDTDSGETLTQLLLSEYAQQHGVGDTSRSQRRPLPAQPALQFQLESESILLNCEVTEVHFLENRGTAGIFQSATIRMDAYQKES